jgi:hypothetical protein
VTLRSRTIFSASFSNRIFLFDSLCLLLLSSFSYRLLALIVLKFSSFFLSFLSIYRPYLSILLSVSLPPDNFINSVVLRYANK